MNIHLNNQISHLEQTRLGEKTTMERLGPYNLLAFQLFHHENICLVRYSFIYVFFF